MPNDISLTPLTPPPGTCVTDATSIIDLISNYIQATITQPGSLFAYGFATPPISQQDRPWVRLDSTGKIIGIYSFVSGNWIIGNTSGDKTGDMKAFFGDESTIIDPWFICNGQTVIRGYGSVTVPDLRGRTAVGTGSGAGLTTRNQGDIGGEENHQLVVTELASHSHGLAVTATSAFGAGGNPGGVGAGNTYQTGTTGNDTPHNNMQPFLAVAWQMYVTPG